jgi:hypothetical protein
VGLQVGLSAVHFDPLRVCHKGEIDYYQRKLDERKTDKEALRALKRQLSTVVYRRLLDDYQTAKSGSFPQPLDTEELTSSRRPTYSLLGSYAIVATARYDQVIVMTTSVSGAT